MRQIKNFSKEGFGEPSQMVPQKHFGRNHLRRFLPSPLPCTCLKLSSYDSFQVLSFATIALWMLIFALCPFVLLTILSFLQRNEEHFVDWHFNIHNYIALLDPLYVEVLWNSFWIAGISTFACLLLGFPVAYAVTLCKKQQQTAMLLLLMLPFWINSLIRLYALRSFLGAEGLLNRVLLSLHMVVEPLDILYTPFAVCLGTFYLYFPFMVLPLFAVLEKIDPKLIEAARDLGAKGPAIFWYILWPLSRSGVIAGCILVFLPSLGCFCASMLLGGSKVQVLGSSVSAAFLEAGDWPLGAALSMFLFIFMLLLLLVYVKALKRELA